ncbi:MAG: hypothetical protein KF886_21655 [Candidatus Hydrogenedentes bacterium]|nr:hypothetical protein [Candidatus Hydrogenedentota bacterium]
MTDVLIFLSGTFISLLTLAGFALTFREFKYMGEHPEEFPRDYAHLREGGKSKP